MNAENPLPHSLNQLYFYLTEGCNLACRHCWLAPKLDREVKLATLPVETFETAIREAKPMGLNRVKLTGGEPLMHPHILELLEIVRRNELGVGIETNGLLCTPQLAAEIARNPQRSVSVSLDGADAGTHEWVRGVPGSFEAACRAVRLLAEAGLRPQIIFSVLSHNLHQAAEMPALAEKLGAASLKYNLVQPTQRGEKLHEAEETPGITELIALGRRVDVELASLTPVRLIYDYPIAFRPLNRLFHGEGSGTCGIRGILGVLASGEYALCGIGETIPELVFGRVGQDPLERVWNEHPLLVALHDGLPQKLEGICSQCLMAGLCLGACVAQNYYRARNLWAPYWFCDEAEKAGLFPASRLKK